MLTAWLDQFKPIGTNQGEMSLLDIHLAKFLTEKMVLTDELANKRFSFLILQLSRQVRAGHVCLDITKLNQLASDFWQLLVEHTLKCLTFFN